MGYTETEGAEILAGKQIDADGLNDVYKDLYDCVGAENMIKIYARLKGSQITFPQRLFSSEYVKRQVLKKYNGDNIKQLAREYEYSEKWIRQMIKEGKKKN